MSIYLKETKLSNGKTIQQVVKLSSNPKFWKKEKADITNKHNMYFNTNKSGLVTSVFSNAYDGTKTTYKLMQKGNRIRK